MPVLEVSVRRVLRFLWLVVVVILGLHLALQLLPLDFPGSHLLMLKVHIDEERAFPTYLSSMLLTACGLLAWWLARIERLPWPGWSLLAIVFLVAGVDEVAAIHEEFSDPLRSALVVGGWLRFAWVILGASISLVIALLFLRAFLAIPAAVRWQLALGAGLFLLGAIGMELPGGYLKESQGIESAPYVLVSTIEEGLEMAGTLVWLRALTTHLRDVAATPALRLAS